MPHKLWLMTRAPTSMPIFLSILLLSWCTDVSMIKSLGILWHHLWVCMWFVWVVWVFDWGGGGIQWSRSRSITVCKYKNLVWKAKKDKIIPKSHLLQGRTRTKSRMFKDREMQKEASTFSTFFRAILSNFDNNDEQKQCHRHRRKHYHSYCELRKPSWIKLYLHPMRWVQSTGVCSILFVQHTLDLELGPSKKDASHLAGLTITFTIADLRLNLEDLKRSDNRGT